MDDMADGLYEYLKANYNQNVPIFAKDIRFQKMSPSNIRYHLAHMANKGLIAKYEPGIYYFPKEDITGAAVALSPDNIVYDKYIRSSGDCIGFYSGYTFANRIGLSAQVPYVKEICSNAAPAPVREIMIQQSKYILRKPPVPVTEENVNTLQLLDCLKNFDRCADEPMHTCSSILSQYCKVYKISKTMVDKYIRYYPKSVFSTIYWTEVKFYVPS
ncbi:MAG: hypothetical protein LUG93_02170 [Lachnospiraceae bacterium]|nr:hypothetical protein [Lachnospiraceae bacterium]